MSTLLCSFFKLGEQNWLEAEKNKDKKTQKREEDKEELYEEEEEEEDTITMSRY